MTGLLSWDVCVKGVFILEALSVALSVGLGSRLERG